MANVSPVGRVSYPNVFEPRSYEDSKPKYSVTLIFEKGTDLSEMKKIAENVAKEKFGPKLPSNFRSPFRDGDEKNEDGEHPEYEGMVYIQFKANENRRPTVVDPKKFPIAKDDPDGLYAGCYARVAFSCYAYDTRGNKGVAFGLNHIQKAKDGDRFDNTVSADDAFDALETPDEDIF